MRSRCAKAHGPLRRRGPPVPDGARRGLADYFRRRLACLESGGQQVCLDVPGRAVERRSVGEMVVFRRRRLGRRFPAETVGGGECDRGDGRVRVPGAGREVQPRGPFGAEIHIELDSLPFSHAHFPDHCVIVVPRLRRGLPDAVLPHCRQHLDVRGAFGAVVSAAAVCGNLHASRHVGIHRQRERHAVLPIGRAPLPVHGDAKIRRGGAADDRPCQPGARGGGVDAMWRHARPVPAGCWILDDDPLDIVAARSGRVLAAGCRVAIGVLVQPEIEVVQYGAADRVGGRFVPRQDEIQAAGAFRHDDVLEAVAAAIQRRGRSAILPAIRPLALQHAGARRRLAEAVLCLQHARAFAVVGGEGAAGSEPCIRLDGAGHQPRPGQRRLLAVVGNGVHQERCDASDGRRRHACAAGSAVAAAAALAPRRVHVHAGGDELRGQAPVERRAPAAESRQFAVVVHGANRQRVLGCAVVREAADARIGVRDDVELSMRPNHRVQLAFGRCSTVPDSSGSREAHVHDQRLRGQSFAAASRSLGEKVHAPMDAVSEPPAAST